jgi:hypothetical protein
MHSIFLFAAYAMSFVAGLWIVVLAWQKGILWGIGCLLFPLIQLLYIALNWKETKQPFFLMLGGFASMLLAAFLD